MAKLEERLAFSLFQTESFWRQCEGPHVKALFARIRKRDRVGMNITQTVQETCEAQVDRPC